MPSRVIISSVNMNTPRNAAPPGLLGGSLEPALDVPLHIAAGPPHVDRQRGDEDGGDQREHTFPERLIRGLGKEQPGANAEQNGGHDSPVHRGDESSAAGLLEVGKADGDDQEGFEPFTQGHDECLQHGPLIRGNETDLVLKA